MTRVAIAHHEDIERSIAEALGHLDLADRFRDRLVAVKTNDTWADEDDTTAVTQPDALRAVLRLLKDLGPRHIVVTGGSGAGETDEIFRVAGLMDVVESEGVEFHDHNRPPFTNVTLEGPGPQQEVVVNERVTSYERLVVLSNLKMHRIATVTLALKNLAMSYPAADHYGHPRSEERHQHAFFDDMHSFIAAMAKRFPIDLAVTVGHPAMVGTGPIGGYTFRTGLTIASTDAVAADVVGARLLGFAPQGVRHLWEACGLELGESDLERMDFPGLSPKEAAELFTKAAYGEASTLRL